MRKRAPAGDSQVLVAVDAKGGKPGGKDERIWVSVSTKKHTATLIADCQSLFPEDVPAFEAACRQMVETGHPDLVIDLRKVRHIPSMLIGQVAKAGVEAREAGRRLVVLINRHTAGVAKMVLGDTMDVRVSPR